MLKVFFSIISQRLTEFLLKNNYIDPLVQKGGIPGVPGCLEHTGVVTQLIRMRTEATYVCCGWIWPMHMDPFHTDWWILHYTATMSPVRSRT